jgi:division protein CdvB (Snf7/Vps24/ESCRT-III family)
MNVIQEIESEVSKLKESINQFKDLAISLNERYKELKETKPEDSETQQVKQEIGEYVATLLSLKEQLVAIQQRLNNVDLESGTAIVEEGPQESCDTEDTSMDEIQSENENENE